MKIDMLRTRGTAALVALIALSAWLGISNHCVLAAASAQVSNATDCCPYHARPVKQQKQTDVQPCCKVLRALVTPSAKIPSRCVIELPHLDLSPADSIIFAPPKISIDRTGLDTGPPGAFSFAELILQRSILSHAPPFLA